MGDKIIKNYLTLSYYNNLTEIAYSEDKNRHICKYNLFPFILGTIAAVLNSVYFIFNMELNRKLQNSYSSFIISHTISFIYLCLLLPVIKYKNNIALQRTSSCLNYYLIFYVIAFLRGYSYVNKQIDGTSYTIVFILELLTRMAWNFIGMYRWWETIVYNLAIVLSQLVYGPYNNLTVGYTITLSSFNITYIMIIGLVIVTGYFHVIQDKFVFYYHYSLTKNVLWYKSVFNNMNAGFFYIQNSKSDKNKPISIKYLNNTMINRIKHTRALCELINSYEINSELKQTSIAVNQEASKFSGPSRPGESSLFTSNDPNSNDFDFYKELLNMHSEKVIEVLLNNLSTEIFSSSKKFYGEGNKEECSSIMSSVNKESEQSKLAKNNNCLIKSKFFENFKKEFLKIEDNYKFTNGEKANNNFKLIGTKTLENRNLNEAHDFTFEVYCRYYYNQDNDSEDFEFIFNDVSRTKVVEQKNAEFKYKAVFLSKIAHEFKNPLICIIELVNQIYDALKNQNTDAQSSNNTTYSKTLPLIKSLSNYLLILVKDLDCFSQSQMGKALKLEYSDCNLKDILNFCKEVTLGLINKNNKSQVKFKIIKKSNVPKRVFTDEIKLKQILINLLSNAVKFTSNGSISLAVEIEGDDLIKISVIDTGNGISENNKRHMFKAYNKGHLGNNKIGAGLGLSIVADLTAKLGKRVDFTSVQGVGSTFSLL